LHALDRALRQRGSRHVVRSGDPTEVVPQVARLCGAERIIAEADATTYAQRRDRTVAERFPSLLVPGLTIAPLGSVRTASGAPHRVFAQVTRAQTRAISSPHPNGSRPRT